MQEGILSLMQLPKTVCAVEDLHDAGVPMFIVMTHPTTAGVLASFASLGDVTIAEPGALIAFTGPRVVQQTTREKLPDDFGLAEQNLRFGHIDAIVPAPRAARLPGARCCGSSPEREPETRSSACASGCRRLSRLPLLRGARVSGEAARLAAAARPAPRRHVRRGDLALGRARAASRPAVHARLRRADPRRLGRAARRPRPRRRRRARRRARQARRPHGRARRPPEGPRRQGADRPAVRDGVSRRATSRRCA